MSRVRTFETVRRIRKQIDRAIATVALSLVGVFGAIVAVNLPT